MWRPWTGPPAGRQGHKTGQQRQGLGARSPRSPRCCWKPHADGHRHAAGRSESQPGGARKPCSCPAMILEETGVGVRLRSGEQAGKLGTRTAPPQGAPCSHPCGLQAREFPAGLDFSRAPLALLCGDALRGRPGSQLPFILFLFPVLPLAPLVR